MPLVQMPDGHIVNMPDKLTSEQAARLKARMDMLSKAKAAEADRLAKAAKPPENPTSALNLAGAAVEPMMSMASGAVAQPLSGIAGLLAGGANALGITDTPAADVVDKVGNALTYSPRTTGGQNAMKAFGAIPEAIHSGSEWAGNKTLDWSHSPALATGVQTLLEAAPQILGAKGGMKVAETPGVLKPKAADPRIKALADKGVVTTPGQRGGEKSWRNTSEQKLMSLPVGGNSIAKRRAESVKRWSEHDLDEVISDISGKPIPPNKRGRDAYLHTYTELQSKYNALLPKMRGSLDTVDPTSGASLRTQWTQIRQKVLAKGNGMNNKDSALVTRIIDDAMKRFPQNGRVKGNVLSDIKETLRSEAADLKRGDNSERKASKALDDALDFFHGMLRRDNPALAPQLQKLDAAYRKYQDSAVASRIGGKGQNGVYTPNQKLRAIERRDKSKDKGDFAKGTAHGQKDAETASEVLGNTVPDSGTPGRLELIELLKNPFGSATGLAAATLTPLLYSKPVQKMLQNRALKGQNRPAKASGAVLGSGASQDNRENWMLRNAGAVP